MPQKIRINLEKAFSATNAMGEGDCFSMNWRAHAKVDKMIAREEGFNIWYITLTGELDCEKQWNFLLSLLTVDERSKVLRFYVKADQQRSLLSTLIQKSLIRQNFGAEDTEFEIRRTREVSSPTSLILKPPVTFA